jgi:hypothetical protein
MVAIPRDEQDLIGRIYASYEREAGTGTYLARIGASGIGGECLREIWLSWRAASKEHIDGRVLRLLKTGNIQEDRVIADLRAAGLSVWDKDDDGKQFSRTDTSGHVVAKPDGIVKGVPGSEKSAHLLEIKSSNDNNFKDLVKNGLKKSKPEHYSQLQYGMSLFGIDRGLYVVINKNNEQYYIERVHLDQAEIDRLNQRIDSLLGTNTPPPRISDQPSRYPCGFCDQNGVCFKTAPIEKNCRTCSFVEVLKDGDGSWVCGKTNTTRWRDEQLEGCEEWQPIFA